jgi:hypothetical protein
MSTAPRPAIRANIHTTFIVEKVAPNFVCLSNLKKTPKLNNHPIGENSANLFTLLLRNNFNELQFSSTGSSTWGRLFMFNQLNIYWKIFYRSETFKLSIKEA